MTEWKTYKLGDILNFRRGHDLPKIEMVDGEIPVAGSNGVIGYHNVSTPIEPCITIGRSGNVGTPYIYDKCWAHNTVLYVDDFKGNDPLYLYYLLKTIPLASYGGGSAVPTLNRNHIHPIEIKHTPSLEEQRRIAGILGAIDDKIENNRRINTNLELQAQALYKQWFVDNRKDDWEEKPLSEIITIYDSQRKPLSGQQREKMDKVYPYYGAASLMDYVDDYLFDGIYLLLGEDGTVVDELGFPILQYVWGKFWVNNHAHILTGKNGFSTETLYVLLKQTSVKSIVTGAVQPKISQANLKNISVTIPPIHQLNKYNEVIEPLFKTIRKNNDESSRLATLRDTLLPKLMNGEIITK